MKVEQNSLPPTPDRLDHTSAVTPGETRQPASSFLPATDAVRVSGDAQLAASAAARADTLDDVRPDVVARAKEALAKGEVGADLDRLATRIIDGLLDE